MPSRDMLLNRELSWLAFNERVLHEAERPDVPLLERVRFLTIVSSNLDEFFMVRVAGLKHQIRVHEIVRSPDGMGPAEALEAISAAAHAQVARQYALYRDQLAGPLDAASIRLLPLGKLDAEQQRHVEELFVQRVLPILTPMVVDQSHPFPWMANLSLNLAVVVARPESGRRLAIVPVPRGAARLLPVPARSDGTMAGHVFIEELMVHRLADLFPGSRVLDWLVFRLTRDAEVEVDPESVQDFRKAMEWQILRRRRSGAVRLEATAGRGDGLVRRICAKVGLQPDDVYRLDGPIDLRALAGLCDLSGREDLRYAPHVPARRRDLEEGSIWDQIRARDVLIHHPYESFDPVVRFVSEAADDPDVLAIKITLYRPGPQSEIVEALVRAAERDKQVAAIVELLARFDEEKNIAWSRRLERAGAHVIYGVVGLKTHAKIALVVRREEGGIRRYVHLSTGNYSARTARTYTDLSLFTCDDDFGFDASGFFNLLTGYSDPPEFRRFVMAPLQIRSRLRALIAREADHARHGVPAEIAIKVNSLSDPEMVGEMCEAARAGAQVRLIVRGLCCLRPGVKGQSERVEVISIVDRFLEHSRIYYFANAGREEVYLSSADPMPRNLDRRVELLYPVLSAPLRDRLRAMLRSYLKDNERSWTLAADGTYHERVRRAGELPFRVQEHFQEEARRSLPGEPNIVAFHPRARRYDVSQ